MHWTIFVLLESFTLSYKITILKVHKSILGKIKIRKQVQANFKTWIRQWDFFLKIEY